jgi:flagellum-specific peptidoglycan hydrolase FlgJ
LRSDSEYEAYERVDEAKNTQNTPRQQSLLESGDLDQYQLSKHPDLPKTPNATSADTFAPEALQTTRALLAGTTIFPEVAAAVSGLESSWGSRVKGNNYFGIKGNGQTFLTHEEVDGVLVPQMDDFKTFKSFPHAVQGFRNFLHDNPRYEAALAAETPEEQAQGLQDAGYATDSKYAEKLINIMSQPRFK